MPMASAPQALPLAISARIRLVPSCAAVTFTAPRASRMVITNGFSFFSTPFASEASRILRAISRVSSAIFLSWFLSLEVKRSSRCRLIETHRQHAGDVKRFALRAVLDLVPAGRAVGDDKGLLIRTTDGGQ